VRPMLFEKILPKRVEISLDPASPSQSHRPKNKKPNPGRKAAAGGIQGVSTAWAVNASSVTYLLNAYSHNLAGIPPSVNHLGELEHADGLHCWLPGLGTLVRRERAFQT
jgi:hypothetical protein